LPSPHVFGTKAEVTWISSLLEAVSLRLRFARQFSHYP
jgi:hypothetical protein